MEDRRRSKVLSGAFLRLLAILELRPFHSHSALNLRNFERKVRILEDRAHTSSVIFSRTTTTTSLFLLHPHPNPSQHAVHPFPVFLSSVSLRTEKQQNNVLAPVSR